MAVPQSYIQQLLTKASLSQQEKEQLLEFLEQGNSPELEQWLLQQYNHDIQENEKIDAGITKNMWQHITARTGTNVSRLLKWNPRWAAAAILILAIGTGVYFYTTSSKTEQSAGTISKQLPADIAPGGEKAILTLADGTTITLDNASNGIIAQQGNSSVVKLDNGQIVYNADGPANDIIMTNTMATPRGGQYKLTLPDGSRVWLNAASSIKFPSAFTGNVRQVEITGEVYMEIEKNARQSFIVKANGTDIQVLGTSFNVNAYEEESSVKTTLIEGSVNVISGNETVLLKPGQQAVAGQKQNIHIQPANADQALAWKNGFFSFDNTDIQTVMRQLERWYDVNVIYRGAVPVVKLNGELDRKIPLSDVLKYLSRLNIRFERNDRTIIILP